MGEEEPAKGGGVAAAVEAAPAPATTSPTVEPADADAEKKAGSAEDGADGGFKLNAEAPSFNPSAASASTSDRRGKGRNSNQMNAAQYQQRLQLMQQQQMRAAGYAGAGHPAMTAALAANIPTSNYMLGGANAGRIPGIPPNTPASAINPLMLQKMIAQQRVMQQQQQQQQMGLAQSRYAPAIPPSSTMPGYQQLLQMQLLKSYEQGAVGRSGDLNTVARTPSGGYPVPGNQGAASVPGDKRPGAGASPLEITLADGRRVDLNKKNPRQQGPMSASDVAAQITSLLTLNTDDGKNASAAKPTEPAGKVIDNWMQVHTAVKERVNTRVNAMRHLKIDSRKKHFIVAPRGMDGAAKVFAEMTAGDLARFHRDLADVVAALKAPQEIHIPFGSWKMYTEPTMAITVQDYDEEVRQLTQPTAPAGTTRARPSPALDARDSLKYVTRQVVDIDPAYKVFRNCTFVEAVLKGVDLEKLYAYFTATFRDLPGFEVQIHNLVGNGRKKTEFAIKTEKAYLGKLPNGGMLTTASGSIVAWNNLASEPMAYANDDGVPGLLFTKRKQ